MPIVDREMLQKLFSTRTPARLELDIAAKFKAGDRVRAHSVKPPGHTRLPIYICGREGVVQRDHGVFHLPDSRVAGEGDKPQHIYSVRFAARELWGPEAPPKDTLCIDLWDDYLDGA